MTVFNIRQPEIKSTKTASQRIIAALKARRRTYKFDFDNGLEATVTQFASGPFPYLLQIRTDLGSVIERRFETMFQAKAAARRLAHQLGAEVAA